MELQDELILALHNLVKLKEHKDENGKDEFYLKHQPHVWEYAKHVLKLCEGKDTSDESSGLIKPDVSSSVCKCPYCSTEMKGIELTHYKCNNCNLYFTN